MNWKFLFVEWFDWIMGSVVKNCLITLILIAFLALGVVTTVLGLLGDSYVIHWSWDFNNEIVE
jgi:hypothetical protein